MKNFFELFFCILCDRKKCHVDLAIYVIFCFAVVFLKTTKLESRLDYRSGGLDFHNPPMLLEQNTNYSHLQRSIDTLRSLGDRLGDRNVDLRLNLHQDRGYDRNGQLGNGLELNLSLNSDRLMQERNLERLLNERTMQDQRMNLDHSLSLERLNLERSLSQNLPSHQNQDRGYNDRSTLINERALMDRNLNSLDRNLNNIDRMPYGIPDRLTERLRTDASDMRHSDIRDINRDINRDLTNRDLSNRDLNDLKYREYKSHLENLRTESSRSLERGNGEDDRGTTPSTPPTPISVGENFQEEKVKIN